jgi:hypothetical protein
MHAMEVQNILYACLNKMMLSALLMYFVLFFSIDYRMMVLLPLVAVKLNTLTIKVRLEP